jgi:hypothetical protein
MTLICNYHSHKQLVANDSFSSSALKRWKKKLGLGKLWNSKNIHIILSSGNYVNAFDPSFYIHFKSWWQ